jgi:esterase/lipase superfamily enzyme
MNGDCGWSAADARDFHAGDDLPMPTVVFVHGNHTDADDAVTKGWYVYQTICSQAAGKPFRYVIWSWPADRVFRRHRADAQLKAEHSDAQAYCFATWLHDVRPGAKVSLVGHSFGPRIITGALHLLAGGELAGQKLPADTVAAWTSGKRPTVRAVLLAAAADADWLACDGHHGLACSLADEMLVTRNGCDKVLKWYPRLYGRGGPEAMGFVGPCGIDDPQKLAVVDVSCTVGKTHDYQCYCSASNVCSRLAHYTFLDDLPAQAARVKNAR